MWLYWKRNKNFIITTIVAALVIIVGVQSYKLYAANAKAQLANAYAQATTSEELAKFAAENSGKKLAGVALLQNGDKLFSEGKYADAQKAYADAQKDLKGNVLEGGIQKRDGRRKQRLLRQNGGNVAQPTELSNPNTKLVKRTARNKHRAFFCARNAGESGKQKHWEKKHKNNLQERGINEIRTNFNYRACSSAVRAGDS